MSSKALNFQLDRNNLWRRVFGSIDFADTLYCGKIYSVGEKEYFINVVGLWAFTFLILFLFVEFFHFYEVK